MKINLIFADYPQAQSKGNLAREHCLRNYTMGNLTTTLTQVLNLIVVK